MPGNNKLPSEPHSQEACESRERLLNGGGYHDDCDGHNPLCGRFHKSQVVSSVDLAPSVVGSRTAIAAARLFSGMHAKLQAQPLRACGARDCSSRVEAMRNPRGGVFKHIGRSASQITSSGGNIGGSIIGAAALLHGVATRAPATSAVAASISACMPTEAAESAHAPQLAPCCTDNASLSAMLAEPDDDAIVLDHVVGPGGLDKYDVFYYVSEQGHNTWHHAKRLPNGCWRSVRRYNKAHGLAKGRA